MSAKITTPFGEAVPPAPRHSVTVHMGGGWDTVEKYGTNSSSVISLFKNAYPRMKPHRDIAQVSSSRRRLETSCCLIATLKLFNIACVSGPGEGRRSQCGLFSVLVLAVGERMHRVCHFQQARQWRRKGTRAAGTYRSSSLPCRGRLFCRPVSSWLPANSRPVLEYCRRRRLFAICGSQLGSSESTGGNPLTRE